MTYAFFSDNQLADIQQAQEIQKILRERQSKPTKRKLSLFEKQRRREKTIARKEEHRRLQERADQRQKEEMQRRSPAWHRIITDKRFKEWYRATLNQNPDEFEKISQADALHILEMQITELLSDNKSMPMDEAKTYVLEHGSLPIDVKSSQRRFLRMFFATPVWADKEKIKAVYADRDKMSMDCPDGGPYAVDHIIPIAGDTVCGLHVHNNLRVISKSENSAKWSTFIPELLTN